MESVTELPDEQGSLRKLPGRRMAEIAAYVSDVGEATVAELADRFDVSPYTIRRDLDRLDSDGILIRTHGGGLSPKGFPKPDSELDVRAKIHTAAKDSIGRLAAGLLENNSTITINSGTTTLSLVRQLRDHRELTIVTNSLTIPATINPLACRDLYVLGGAVRFTSQATIGPTEIQFGEQNYRIKVRSDLAFMGVGAVSVGQGYSTSNVAEASMMATMMSQAERVAILADSSKFDRSLFAQIGPLEVADYFVTDRIPEGQLYESLVEAGVEVVTPDGV